MKEFKMSTCNFCGKDIENKFCYHCHGELIVNLNKNYGYQDGSIVAPEEKILK